MSEQDTREKLEADVHQFANPSGRVDNIGAHWEKRMLGFLDRQAAITEQEVEHDLMKAGRMAVEVERERIKKLTDERDKLQEQLRIGWECECRLQAERERYREKFGKCIDYADAIHALMDDEGMA